MDYSSKNSIPSSLSMSFLRASSMGNFSPEICGDLTPVTITITFIDFSRSLLICAPEINFASGESCSPTF